MPYGRNTSASAAAFFSRSALNCSGRALTLFNTAPLIGPGEYRDTLLPGERLFYGVKLGAGQRLRISGQLRGRQNVIEVSFERRVAGRRYLERRAEVRRRLNERRHLLR